MKEILRHIIARVMLIVMAFAATAQVPSTDLSNSSDLSDLSDQSDLSDGAERSDAPSAQAFLLTVGPGDAVWTLEGHTAIMIVTPSGSNVVYNWGTYDFTSPNFAYRFTKGETDYFLEAMSIDYFLFDYYNSGRSVTAQLLNLDADQLACLTALCVDNLRPQNRTYRYNYVKDNCATRPLNIIERAIASDGSHLRIDLPDAETTYRREMRRYHTARPDYQFFIDLVLGSGLDYSITPREQAFAPLFLEDLAANSTIVAADGSERPLVAAQPVELLPDRRGDRSAHSSLLNINMLICAIFVLTVLMTWRDVKRMAVCRAYDGVLFFLFGLIGLLLTFLIFVSTHEATSPNINYLWANPLCLLVPLLIGFRRCRKVVLGYNVLNFILVAVFIVGLPLFHQSSSWLIVLLALCSLMRSGSYIYITRHAQA